MVNESNWVKGIVKNAYPYYVKRDQPPGWKVGDRWRILKCEANIRIDLPNFYYNYRDPLNGKQRRSKYLVSVHARSLLIGSFAQFGERINNDDKSLRWVIGFELEVNINHLRFKKPGFMPEEAIRFTLNELEEYLAYKLMVED